MESVNVDGHEIDDLSDSLVAAGSVGEAKGLERDTSLKMILSLESHIKTRPNLLVDGGREASLDPGAHPVHQVVVLIEHERRELGSDKHGERKEDSVPHWPAHLLSEADQRPGKNYIKDLLAFLSVQDH